MDVRPFEDLIERLDHVAIAVSEIKEALPMVEALGGRYFCGATSVRSQFTWVQFHLANLAKLELIAPNSPESFVSRFLEDRGPGLHHLTFRVSDVSETARRAQSHGYRILGPNLNPIWNEVFLHPKNPLGTLVQFASWPSDDPWTANSLDDVLAGLALDDL
ncbi:MAG TPA: VOC family protein [Acidimicrobiia bacterium]|jgi:methylmalonyl-CoA/ethylmalonyl-CoA epimerase|nr:VOC family protein [Acidimicrobiia bacterium]